MAHYVREHDVPEVDVAAALAVVAQGDEPLLLDPAAERPVREPPRRASATVPSAPRPAASAPSRGSDVPLATYRINVGKRHKVEPRQIVGAIANEGGLSRRTSATSRSARTSPWSSCPPTCRPRSSRR